MLSFYPGSGDKSFDEGSDNEGLTAEEIADFELNRNRIRQERIVLREKIRKNFEQLCVKNEEKPNTNHFMGNGDNADLSERTAVGGLE